MATNFTTTSQSVILRAVSSSSIIANSTAASPVISSTVPYYQQGREIYFTNKAKDQRVLSKEEIIEEYYAAYDVMTGVRIGATLGGLITLFTLFLVYKSKCRAYREAAHEKARLKLEEKKRVEKLNLTNRTLGSKCYYTAGGGNGFAGTSLNCDSGSTSPSSDNTNMPRSRQTLRDVALRPRPVCLIQTTAGTSPAVSSSVISDPSSSSSTSQKNTSGHVPPVQEHAMDRLEVTVGKVETRRNDIPQRQSTSSLSTGHSKSPTTTCSASGETAPPHNSTSDGSKTVISHCNPLLYQRDSQASTSGESAVLNLRVSTEETSSGEVSLGNYPLTVIKCNKPNSEVFHVIVQKEE